MAQTKLLNILSSVSAQIGDPGNVTYGQSEVLAGVNIARGNIYNENLLRICGIESVSRSDIGVFGEIFPEWLNDNVNLITAITGSTTLTITTKKAHRLITGQLITISGVSGFGTNPNGNYSVLGTGLTENQFQITHTVVSGSYSSGGKIVVRLSGNELIKPADCRMILSGLINASAPVITNGLVKRLNAETYHEAKYNTYSPFEASNDTVKMYQKNDIIEVIGAAGVSITGNIEIIYISEPVDAVVNANYNDIVDPAVWMNNIIDLASEIIMSYQLT